MPAVPIVEVEEKRSVDKETERDLEPRNPITKKRVQEICVNNGFYRTPNCNDKLYLHHKGFDKIQELEEYTEVKVLWIEGNCLSKIEGLESMKSTLRSLYIHENLLQSLDGVSIFENLDAINVSDNHLDNFKGFSTPVPSGMDDAASTTEAAAPLGNESRPLIFASLNTLQAKNNYFKAPSDIEVLTEFEKLSVLDLSGNKLEDGEGVLNILEKMPALKSLRLSGNPFVRKMPQYRRTILSRCTNLMHLDDRPVFEDERRTVTAWVSGGAEGEKAERQKMKQEEQDKITRRLEEFRQMCLNAGATEAQISSTGMTEEDDDTDASSASSGEDERDASGGEPQQTPPSPNRVLSSNTIPDNKHTAKHADPNSSTDETTGAASKFQEMLERAEEEQSTFITQSPKRGVVIEEASDEEEDEGELWTPE